MSAPLTPQETIALLRTRAVEIRTRFGVRSLAVFGSTARGDATSASDIDLLVEFESASTFDGYMDLKLYLEDLLGRRVDLVTHKALRPRVRAAIAHELLHVA